MNPPFKIPFSPLSAERAFPTSTREFESLHTATIGVTNSTMEATASCKRTLLDAAEYEHLAEPKIGLGITTGKRRRLLPQPFVDGTGFQSTADFLTPPITPPQEPLLRGIRLKVDIPQPTISKESERKLKTRRAAADRWVSKLQNPFPKNKEIKDAYKYKLMRHYTDENVSAEPDFIKPQIDRSPRIDLLRERFPVLSTSLEVSKSPTYTGSNARLIGHGKTRKDTTEDEKHNELLQKNKRITRSAAAQKLAWEAFSSREKDRVDRGREAMMQSGLCNDELKKEAIGVPNDLPEWRKRKTGRFAKSVGCKQVSERGEDLRVRL